MLVIITLIIILIMATSVMSKVFKRKMKAQATVRNGVHFEAHIIGVAHPRAILNIEGQPNRTTEILGIEMTDTTQAHRHEAMNRIRVKISYTDPATRQPTIAHRVLNRSEYTDDRLITIGNPGTLTLGSKSIAYMKHNKKLYTAYVKDVEARSLTKEEKKHLIQAAALAMNNQNDQHIKDHEGYNVLTPPVEADGYMLNGEIHFVQKTNTPIFNDWTRGLA